MIVVGLVSVPTLSALDDECGGIERHLADPDDHPGGRGRCRCDA